MTQSSNSEFHGRLIDGLTTPDRLIDGLLPRCQVVDGFLTRSLRARVLRPTPTRPDEWLPGDDEPEKLIHFAVIDQSINQPTNQPINQTTDQPINQPTDQPFVMSTCFIYAEPCDWLPTHQPAYHLRQMATDPAYRSRGAGVAVIEGVVDWLHKQWQTQQSINQSDSDNSTNESDSDNKTLLWCYAREPAMHFYMKQGFECVGDVFVSEAHLNIPHIRMQKWIVHDKCN